MKLAGKRVLVTGASGFIGSHLVQRLVAGNAPVPALTQYRSEPSLDNLRLLAQDELGAIEIVGGNIEDAFFVRRAVANCDVVFHLAALIAIPYSYVAPASYVATNVSGTLNVLEACRAEETPRIVHTSTSECYGSAIYTPIDEEDPLQAQSPYSASKIAADKLAESYYKSFDLPVVTIRPFNTFGPRQTARAVIPTIISQLAAGRETITLGSLDPVRDFTFVGDTVDGFIRGAETEGVQGQLFNLGVGKGVTIGALAENIIEVFGSNAHVESEDERIRPEKSEVMALISNNSKSREALGWEPRTTLSQGLAHTIEFIQSNSGSFNAAEYGV